MTSLRQIKANRRNALKSTGPRTDAGKRWSRRNAVRHGLTAEVVIEVLEDPRDYKAFERAMTVEFDAQTAVERELVLRLASLFWRLRRATAIESGLLQIQNNLIREAKHERPLRRPSPAPGAAENASVWLVNSMPAIGPDLWAGEQSGHMVPLVNECREDHANRPTPVPPANAEIARCFQRLTNVDNGAFERLSRYESTLWRQVHQILFMLKIMRRQKRNQIWRTNGIRSTSIPGAPRALVDFEE